MTVEVVHGTKPNEEGTQRIFAFLPGKSSAQGWVVFTVKPIPKNLKTLVSGYVNL